MKDFRNSYAQALELAGKAVDETHVYNILSGHFIGKDVPHEISYQLGLAAADAAKAAIRDMWMGYLLGKGE